MKKYTFIFLLLFPLLVYGGGLTTSMCGGGTPVSASCDDTTGMLLAEDAEGTGTPSGWTDVNSVNWDVTSSPLRGSQSVAMDTQGESTKTPATALGGELWGFARLSMTDGNPAATVNPLNIRDSSDVLLWKIAVATNGGIRQYQGTNYDNSSVSFADGAVGPYCIFFHVARGAGTGNGTAQVWIPLCSAICTGGVCTRPETASATTTDGTWDSGDADANHLYMVNGSTDNVLTLDQIRLDTSEFTTVCE